jgi:hypothetical protein
MQDSRDVQRLYTSPGLTYRIILFATRRLVKIELAASHQHFKSYAGSPVYRLAGTVRDADLLI